MSKQENKSLILKIKGMVDAGENISQTLKREFAEETLDSIGLAENERKFVLQALDEVLKKGIEVSFSH